MSHSEGKKLLLHYTTSGY